MNLEQTFLFEGCLYGFKSPSLQVVFDLEGASSSDCVENWCAIGHSLGVRGFPDDPGRYEDTESGFAQCILDTVLAVYQHIKMPLRKQGLKVDLAERGGLGRFAVQIPVLRTSALHVVDILRWLLRNVTQHPQEIEVASFHELLKSLENSVPGSSSGIHFMNAALDKSIPFDWLAEHIVQFGQGKRARRLQGTFTDQTSRMGTLLARDKVLTSRLLSEHGLPVAKSRAVSDLHSAVSAAEQIGYPVVVKAADLDGGVGVAGKISQQGELEEAVAFCLTHTPNIMVEKFVPGRDYRLVVHRGELLWTVERVPGEITGDGRQTIRQLLAEYNSHPMRGVAQHLPLKPLEFDDEAKSLMAEAGYDLDSLLPKGRSVRLRMAANVARGGMVRPAHDEVHPDNRLLAERAANAIGVDLAGIDLLIPDIRVSWMEGGAAICEVNAQPDLGFLTSAHLYPELLSRMVSGNGRIPIIVFVGAGEEQPLPRLVAEAFANFGICVGLSDYRGVSIGGTVITAKPSNPFEDGRMLLRDASVECIILCIDDPSVLNQGLAFDLIDVLVILGPIGLTQDLSTAALLRALAPMCRASYVVENNTKLMAEAHQAGFRNLGSVSERPAQAAERLLSLFRIQTEAKPNSL